MSLINIYETLSAHDAELEKKAAVELEKRAEEDAAGRIMARGFYDELQKLAEKVDSTNFAQGGSRDVGGNTGGTVGTGRGFQTRPTTGGRTMPSRGNTASRSHRAPSAPKLTGQGRLGRSQEVKPTTGEIGGGR